MLDRLYNKGVKMCLATATNRQTVEMVLKRLNLEKYFDRKGAFDISKCNLIAYANGGYYLLGKKVGKFGYSVQKKKKGK